MATVAEQTRPRNGRSELPIKSKGAIGWFLKRSQRLFAGAISKIASDRLEYLVDEDISNGREANKIETWSYKRNDKAPSDFHYVTKYVYTEPIAVEMGLQSMYHCECRDSCTDGTCYCASNHKGSRCYNSKGRLRSSYDLMSPRHIYECNPGCKCNQKVCQNSVIQRGSQVKVCLIRTKSRGWGVRAEEDLKRGTFIGVYSGELVSAKSSTQRQDDTYLFNLSGDTLQLSETDDQYVCDAKFYGNFTRFINHSCEANVIGIRSFTAHHDRRFPYIAFFTNQDIPKNCELTLNYGENYWLIKTKRDGIYCLCKRASCKFRKP